MLHYSTIEPRTLVVLKKFMLHADFSAFSLVGGTNLSLRYGHRISDDIDLFSNVDFDIQYISQCLEKEFVDFNLEYRTTSVGIFAQIDNIKVDLIKNHFHPTIFEIEEIDDIRLYDEREIAAMKIFTVLKRGQKKDFFDLYELLNRYTLNEIISFYNLKFPSNQVLISIPQALCYFDDANQSENPESLTNINWNEVKSGLRKKVDEYLKPGLH